MMWITFIISLLTFACGWVIGWLCIRSKWKVADQTVEMLENRLKEYQEREEKYVYEKAVESEKNHSLTIALAKAEEKLEAQKNELTEMRRTLTEQFRNLATEILEEKSRRFTEENRKSMGQILEPLGKDIEAFRKKVEETYHRESTERTVLERRIAELVQLNQQIRQDAVNLTNALKGNTKVQGDWGEMILERILENSGLVRGREYFVQETIRNGAGQVVHTEDGMSMRPDVTIVYPDRREVIIDSKVSLSAYVNYCNADSEELRDAALKAHVASVRRHIDELADKKYCDYIKDSLDFMMMFIPNESSYTLAMQADDSLWSYAYRKRVLLMSPANLIVSLKLIADLWSREYQSRNAMEIAERGALLYDKCVVFLESLQTVGDYLQKTQGAYEQALARLKTGNGNLVSQALKLKELGVKSQKGNKRIPDEFVPPE